MGTGTDWLNITAVKARYFFALAAAGGLILWIWPLISPRFGLAQITWFPIVVIVGTAVFGLLWIVQGTPVVAKSCRTRWHILRLKRGLLRLKPEQATFLACCLNRDSQFFWSDPDDPLVRPLVRSGVLEDTGGYANGLSEYAVIASIWNYLRRHKSRLMSQARRDEKTFQQALLIFDRRLITPPRSL